MDIQIEQLNERNFEHINQCDGTFTVDARLVLRVEGDEIDYTIQSVSSYEKRYEPEDLDYASFLTDPDRAIFFAYADGQLAGQIILRKWWNNYAWVDDITVDARLRSRGIGRTLMARAEARARERGWPGIMLETQNNNVTACQFYARCGFELGGLDRLLYKGISPNTDEIALFWYLRFEVDPEQDGLPLECR